MNLIDTFLDIEIPQTDNPKLFNANVLSDFPFTKIGVNYLGFPVILISSKFDRTHLTQKNIKLKYIEFTHNVECKVTVNGKSQIDHYSVITFKSDDEAMQNYFFGIVLSLLNSISNKPTQMEIFETFKNFIEVFRALTEIPTKTIQGLWAELLLIEQSNNPTTLINYWHNIPEEKFDFNADTEKIEVKSSSNIERIHYFNAEQLNPTNNSQVIIASIFTKQVSDGLNTIDLLNKIEKRIKDLDIKEKLFRVVSKTLGNTFEQTVKIKFDYELAKNSLLFYKHQDISKIERVNIPERVSEVKFKSDLQSVTPVNFRVFVNYVKLFSAL